MSKKHLFIISSVSFLLSFFILCFTLTEPSVVTTLADKTAIPTIIIDPGHGGEDGGASASETVLEKDLNLSIALKLKSFFISNGYKVLMTRETDTATYDDGVESGKKRSDLQNRVDMFNSSTNNIVISIHQNKFSQSQYSGTQVFYSANNDSSALLAECIKNSVVSLVQPDNTRQCKKAGSEIFILDNTTVPAVLVECGFLSNEIEAQKLQDADYQAKIAYCIYLGFIEYYYRNY